MSRTQTTKVAFANWGNRIAPVFDTASEIHIIETETGRVVRTTQETLAEDLPARKILRLAEMGVSTVVCGAISRPTYGLATAYRIHIVPFVAGDLDEVIQAWLTGNLGRDRFAMPGCYGRGLRHRWGIPSISKEGHEMNGRGRGGTGGGRGQGQGQGRGGQGRGRMGGPRAAGAVGTCVCPKCGYQEPHERGVPCMQKQCPKCGTAMTRQ